jgi:transposase
MVLNQKFSIYKASKKLKISNSTAKSVITNYLKFGTILDRNSKSKIQKLSNVKHEN